MWILSILPDWVFHAILAAGVVGTVAGFVLGMIPIIRTYIIPIRVISILLLSVGLFLEGGMADNEIWQMRVKEVEAKVAVAEAKSQEKNVEIVTVIAEKTKVIREKGQTITKYIDREVAVDREVIKFVENCPIPEIIIKTHNAAAQNKPLELTKPVETEPTKNAPIKSEPISTTEEPVKEKTITATVKQWSNLRETTDRASQKIDKLSPGEKIDIVKLDAKYALVKHNNKQGWVSTDFIKVGG
jgi:hypothetical protein